ncbi:hypothetical protein PX52LOC_02928 [Limnoglobus roseus]|uniref:Uncharacterized protein n=2 Tax=Limnoglobus roseus TaxID=2598579 RepID=A0A5C1A9W2_9BACT|nr:hypothetical protein PX52LOC_02928 [Limnoglobus roseus]
MGNRGILHDADKQIVRPWKLTAWLICRLEFNGRRRTVFSPGRYSELFFLDEATAFAAGHRPCGECRRERYREFKTAWLAANSTDDTEPSIKLIDRQLQAERVGPTRTKRTFEAEWPSLPDGTMIVVGGEPYLIWERRPWRWSFTGYTPTDLASGIADVLTPLSIVEVFRRGLVPQVHGSAIGR